MNHFDSYNPTTTSIFPLTLEDNISVYGIIFVREFQCLRVVLLDQLQ